VTLLPSESHFEAANMLWLEVTNFCNLRCAHCYNVSESGQPLEPSISVVRYQELLGEAHDMGFRCVQFIGGEPMFYPHLRTLIDEAMRLGFSELEIFSNLTTVPDWLFLDAYRGVKIATSFYSDNSDVHNWICGSLTAFERTVASIKRHVAEGFTIRAGFIEMDANKGHFERAKAYLGEIGVTDVGYDAVRQFGRAEGKCEPSMSELCGHCAAGNLSIDVNGKVSGCIMSKPWAFGSVHESNLREVFGSEQRQKFLRDLRGNLEQRKPFEPVLCDPSYRGDCHPQCAPSCYPQQNNCNPCHPLGSLPCNPNGRCSPYDGK
jgi:sulfatase maturation enzyme AslB (radical SAM superfamily)